MHVCLEFLLNTTVLCEYSISMQSEFLNDMIVSDTFISSSYYRYDAIESVESRMQEVLSPTPEGEYVGSAIVQEVFNIGGTGNIAGSKCRDGIIKKGSNVRVMRGDKILTESKVRTLRNFKVRPLTSFNYAH